MFKKVIFRKLKIGFYYLVWTLGFIRIMGPFTGTKWINYRAANEIRFLSEILKLPIHTIYELSISHQEIRKELFEGFDIFEGGTKEHWDNLYRTVAKRVEEGHYL